VLEPLIEAAVAPLRAELADTRGALETARQELGAALERIRTLEATRSTQDGRSARQDAPDPELVADQVAPQPPPLLRTLLTRVRRALGRSGSLTGTRKPSAPVHLANAPGGRLWRSGGPDGVWPRRRGDRAPVRLA
jgi:hypothetical protein